MHSGLVKQKKFSISSARRYSQQSTSYQCSSCFNLIYCTKAVKKIYKFNFKDKTIVLSIKYTFYLKLNLWF